MTAYSPNYLLPYPEDAENPDVPAHIGALALATDAQILALNNADTSLDARLDAYDAMGLGTAWSTYAATVNQGGGALPATTEYARYKLRGRTVELAVSLALTGAGVAGSAIKVVLPQPSIGFRQLGSATIYDASAGPMYWTGALWWSAASVAEIRLSGFTGAAGTATGGMTAALAAGDIVSFVAVYEY